MVCNDCGVRVLGVDCPHCGALVNQGCPDCGRRILREAIQQGETRPVAHTMLLQIYAKRRDTEKFEATARKLRGLVAQDGSEWEKAMALVAAVWPPRSVIHWRDGISHSLTQNLP